MDETKKVLRSILISSPYQINVSKLNSDHEELMGYGIPFKELGYPDLFALLDDIPDVLRIDERNFKSKVMLVLSGKAAHIDKMVMKQKKTGKGPGSFYNTPTPRRQPPPAGRRNFNSSKNHSHSPGFSGGKRPITNNQKSPNQHKSFFQSTQSTSNLITDTPSTSKSNVVSNVNDTKEDVVKKEIDPLNFDLTLKETGKIDNSNNASFLRRPNLTLSGIDSKETTSEGKNANDISSTQGGNFDIDSYQLNVEGTDFMRQLLLTKEFLDAKKPSATGRNIIDRSWPDCVLEEPKFIDENERCSTNVRIPEKIRENLRNLIGDFSEGIWCTKLPGEYFKRYGEDIEYEDLGYRCLITLCMDLEEVFHCRKESSCDYKLYDVRRPVPEYRILGDADQSRTPDERPKSEPPADKVNELRRDWQSYALLIPEDAADPKTAIARRFVDDGVQTGDILDVMAAEIYDLSKFWLYMNDGQLDCLMDELQTFYGSHCDRYKIPEGLLQVGLYCVVFFLGEYHRAQIINVSVEDTDEEDEDDEETTDEEEEDEESTTIKVFYIDYGTVGRVPKKEAWFLASKFAELPAQAIRARLADIWPPVENAHWTYDAIGRFQQLASMKHFEARVSNVLHDKRIIVVFLDYPGSSPTLTLNYLLCEEGHALHASKQRAKPLHNPDCAPKVKYVHLFPYFEEIETGLAPTLAEMLELRDKDVSRDLMMPQYYNYNVDLEMIDEIDRSFDDMLEKHRQGRRTATTKTVKYARVSELKKNFRGVEEMHENLYGPEMYEELRERLKEAEHRWTPDWSDKEDAKDYEKLVRSKRRLGRDFNPFLKRPVTNPFDYAFGGEGKGQGSDSSSSLEEDVNGRLVDVDHDGSFFRKRNKRGKDEIDASKSVVLSTFSIKRNNRRRQPQGRKPSLEWSSTTDSSSSDNSGSDSNDVSSSSTSTSSLTTKKNKMNVGTGKKKKSRSSGSDLISLDVELANPMLMPEVIGTSKVVATSAGDNVIPTYGTGRTRNFIRMLEENDGGNDREEEDKGVVAMVTKSINNSDIAELRSILEMAVLTSSDFVPKNEDYDDDDEKKNAFVVGGSSNVPSSLNDDGNYGETLIVRKSVDINIGVSSGSSSNVPFGLGDDSYKGGRAIVSSRSSCGSSVVPALSRRDVVGPPSSEENARQRRSVGALASRPPPGFGPRPPGGVGGGAASFTAYQPWSTQDCGAAMGANMAAAAAMFAQRMMMPPVMNFCPYPPIYVFNYNNNGGAPPGATGGEDGAASEGGWK